MIDLNQRPKAGERLLVKLWHGDTQVSEITIKIWQRELGNDKVFAASVERRMDNCRMSEAGRLAFKEVRLHDGYECWSEGSVHGGPLTYQRIVDNLQPALGEVWKEWSVASKLLGSLRVEMYVIEKGSESWLSGWSYLPVYREVADPMIMTLDPPELRAAEGRSSRIDA